MSMKTVIYKIENKINKKCYIGSSNNFSKRKQRHFESLKNKCHHSIKLQRAADKYGIENFIICEIESFDFISKEETLKREQFYINQLNPEYNICKIAGSQLGSKRNNDFKLKCSKRMIGNLPWNKGKKGQTHSIETKRKMSQSHENHVVTKKTKELIKNKLSIPILQHTIDGILLNEWPSAKSAALTLHCSYGRLIDYLNGKSPHKTFRKFIWKRKI